jgi:hypothetical protein
MGGGVTEVVCSVLVLFVTLSELPQAATRQVAAKSPPTVKYRKLVVLMVMVRLQIHGV